MDCPGSTGIGVDVLWSGDCTPIPAASASEMQQRCRGLFQRAQVRRYCRWSHSEPHKLWWQQFLWDSGGTGFWHETYFMGGSIEAISDDMNRPTGLARFAPVRPARGAMFSARRRAGRSEPSTVEPVITEAEYYPG